MSARLRAYAAHFALLDAGGTIVTESRREARELMRADTERRRLLGATVWETPDILPLGAWLERSFHRAGLEGVVLDAALEARLWQRVVAESEAGEGLLDSRGAAGLAASAHALALLHGLELESLKPETVEQSAFLAWARRFAALCREHGQVAGAALPARLAQAGPSLGPVLGWHGFATPPPALVRLGAALEARGTRIEHLAAVLPGAQLATLRPESPEAELLAIAGWILARLQRDPDARLAVLIPELGTRESSLKRFLDEHLQPERLVIDHPPERRYALASGAPLLEHALVDSALLVLELGLDALEPERASRLLRSPYLDGSAREAGGRAALEVALRALTRAPLAPTVLAERAGASGLAALEASIRGCREALKGPSHRLPSVWAIAFARALGRSRWCCDRPLDSLEFQTRAKWQSLLERFAGFDALLAPLRLFDAIAELARLAAMTEFQAEEGEPAVVFLDAFQDPGFALDGLWVGGMSAELFPAPASPHPFLPLAWQKSAGLSRASAAIELAHAETLSAAWRGRCAELVCSCPTGDENGEIVASPMLPEAPVPRGLAPPGSRALEVHAARRVESWRDTALPALAGQQPLHGVKALELQSACPFRAGAELRLGARALEARVPGLSRLERGRRAHAALSAIWRTLGDSATLLTLPPGQRREAIEAAVAEAFRDAPRDSPHHALERGWLRRAIDALLDAEAERAPFTVAALETECVGALAGHPFRYRPDRIDRLEDGSLVLVDYKTGARRPREWTGERPDTLQLLSYATQLESAPRALVYAHLPLAQSGFVGLAEEEGLFPGGAVKVPARQRHQAMRGRSWASLMDEWRRTTERLARDFVAGVARVDPAASACDNCPLDGLCRIEPQALAEHREAADEP
jgi:ATP-dependent helicase/nuclease subunit B